MKYIYDQNFFKTLQALLIRSIKIIQPGLFDKIINQLFWTSLNVIVFTYVMPHVGLADNFGYFITITLPASAAFFGAINCIYLLLHDVTSEGSNLRYELTLPVPQWIIFAKYGVENTIQACFLSLFVLPVGYLLTQATMPLTLIGLIKFHLILFATSCFSGFFAIFIVSIAQDILSGLDNVWMRIVLPMWFLGCFQFSWQTLYSITPTLAYINLANPLTYALEGSRAAILFTETSLNYYVCLLMLMVFTMVFGYLGISKLKKRMDCL